MHRAHASIIGVPTVFKKENKKYKLGENAQKEMLFQLERIIVIVVVGI
jgi:hypothetical protein